MNNILNYKNNLDMDNILNYKNNLVVVKPSKNNNFWYELFINGISEGENISIESCIEYGEFLIDSSIDKLMSIDQTTVIDHVWGDYLYTDLVILNCLKLLTGYKTYDEIFVMYEGYTIAEFLEKFN